MAKLSVAKINKLNREMDKKRKIYILEDNDEVDINVKFKETVINRIVMEYITILERISRTEQLDNELVIGSIGLLNLFMLREFSNVPMIPKTSEDLQENIEIADALYNCGIMDAVLEQFDVVEKQKVYDKLNKVSTETGKFLGEAALKEALTSSKDSEEDGF
ncbi:hypothetical protein [Paenibacillus sp. FSL E2-0178]|uniref:hypothetical protein n=1 Tax=Paenibacillus sp. FSL E2-0178 TaxID=2921361 RepID=UPI00315922EC